MTPILPAFTGFVPTALATHYPNASIVAGDQWNGFPASLSNTPFLEPFDPLFATLQKSFITKQKAAYGDVSHVYTLDQYNEIDPISGDLDYLRNVTSNTLASLRAVDPEAIWLMQGWLFFASTISDGFWTVERMEAYLGGVPDDAMIILDLWAEGNPQWNRTNNFYGKPWIWCQLHDFGGSSGAEGDLVTITADPVAALNSPGSMMKGVGLTMEGQSGNEIVYDIVLDQAWSSAPLSVVDYVRQWVSRRYPVPQLPSIVSNAWDVLRSTIYNDTTVGTQATSKGILEIVPSLSGLVDPSLHHTIDPFYDTNTTIVFALRSFLNASNSNNALRAIPEFQFDIVDLGRQLLSNRFFDYYQILVSVNNETSSSPAAISAAGEPLLDILQDLDDLLHTNENFLLSSWIADARQWAGSNTSYAAYMEYNARNQLTLWGPDGEISDYASKQWAGLVGEYYASRWETFIDYLVGLRKSGGQYNDTFVSETMLGIGREWDNQIWGTEKGETWGTKGDTFDVIEKVLQKWA